MLVDDWAALALAFLAYQRGLHYRRLLKIATSEFEKMRPLKRTRCV